MPNIPAIARDQADPKARQLLDGVQKALGITPNMMATMAVSPAVLDAYLAFSGALAKGVLPAKVREQIALTVAEANGCDYCLSAHSYIGRGAGLTDEQIIQSRLGTASDAKTQALLQLAGLLVESRGQADAEDLAAVRAQGGTDAEIAEVVAHVALNVFTNYFNTTADTEIDFPRAAALATTAGHAPGCDCAH